MLTGCSRLENVERHEAMRDSRGPQLDLLNQAIEQWPKRNEELALNIEWLERRPDKELVFGSCILSSQQYANYLKPLLNLSNLDLLNLLAREYEFYEVYGKDRWGEILLTSYYSPVIKGSKTFSNKFSQALYSMPEDLGMISLKDFVAKDILTPEEHSRSQLPALISYDKKGKVETIKAYHSRQEIDEGLVLKGRGLELAYVDPIDAFFLHIQGSGLIEFEDGSLSFLGYAAQNGHRYYSIGKSLFDIIPQEEMSKDKLVDYLKGLTPQKRDELLFENPSYVFFRKLEEGAGQTTFGPSVIDKRTIAIDHRVFPMGGIAFIDFKTPDLKNREELKSFSKDTLEREGRFVLAHDSGGAIKGPGRADLYWGKGEEASINAGVMRHRGKMWFLAPRNCNLK